MPSVTYINQSAPFWDLIASLEQQGPRHPSSAEERPDGPGNEREHEEGPPGYPGPQDPFNPWGWGHHFFGGERGMPHRGGPPPGRRPHRHQDSCAEEKNEDNNEKDADMNDDNDNDNENENEDDNGEGPSGNSGSDNDALKEGRPHGRGRHGRCGGGRGGRGGRCGRGGPPGWGGFGRRHGPGPRHGPGAHHGPPHGPPPPEFSSPFGPPPPDFDPHHAPPHHGPPHHGPPPHGPPHHGPPHHGPPYGGRRGGWGSWGHGGPFGGNSFDPSTFVPQLLSQFIGTHPFNTNDDNKSTTNPTDTQDHTPDADIFDSDSAYTIHVSLPGAKKEDVGVNWDAEKSELSIAGVIYRPGDENFLKTLAMSERKVGAFERKIRLGTRASPASIDIEGITAKLEDGVLRVEVPKMDGGFVEIRKVDVE